MAIVQVSLICTDTEGTPISIPWVAKPSPISPYVQPGDGVLDLGANVGEMTRDFAERVGPTGCVLAVEPDPDNAMICSLLAREYPQVTVWPIAVAAKSGYAILYRDASNSRRQSLWRANLTNDSDKSRLVPTLSLADMAMAVPNLQAIKADLQGAEGLMITGAKDILQWTNLTWCIELWPLGLANAGATLDSVVGELSAAGLMPVDTDWETVRQRGRAKPEGVQNVVFRHEKPERERRGR